MILPPRGTPVDTNRRAELREVLHPQQVIERIDKLVDKELIRLTKIFSDEDVHQLCDELEIKFRERNFIPAITLGLFVSQCLSRGDACSTVLTKFNRERKRQGQAPCSEDASAYCKASSQAQTPNSIQVFQVKSPSPKPCQTDRSQARETRRSALSPRQQSPLPLRPAPKTSPTPSLHWGLNTRWGSHCDPSHPRTSRLARRATNPCPGWRKPPDARHR